MFSRSKCKSREESETIGITEAEIGILDYSLSAKNIQTMISSNPHSNCVAKHFKSSLYKQGNQISERLGNFPKITQLLSYKPGFLLGSI
jgi:hypothetical protein